MKNIFVVLCIVFINIIPLNSQIASSEMISDIEELETLIESKHIAPYRLVSKKKLKSVIELAKKKIGLKENCDEACFVEVLKIVAALNDGHSVVKYNSREALFGFLPFTTRWYKDGLYVTRVPEKFKDLLGSRLEFVEGVEIDLVLEKLKAIIPHGNISRFKKFVYQYIRMPGLLYGLGISNNLDEVSLTFSKDGKNRVAVFTRMSDEVYDKTKFISIDEIVERVPLYDEQKSKYYWYKYDSLNKIFYFKYNRIGNMEKERASAFAKKMWTDVDSLDVEKFVLDIRNNGGGQFAFSMSFIQGILDRPKINMPGKLFIISGYDTFSAALDMLRNLEVKSNAIILGEPPGDFAASSGDAKSYKLKISGIEVQLSSVFHPTVFTEDMRKEIILDKKIEVSWKDYLNGFDPIYDYIKDYTESPQKFVKAETYKSYFGRYRYDNDKHVLIKSIAGKLYIEISNSLISPLYNSKSNTFTTEVNGLIIELKKKCIRINFPDGKSHEFKKIGDEKSGIEYLYDGDFENAKKIYFNIKKDNPNSTLIRDGRFSNLALFAYFELQKASRENASNIAKGILNLGIEINDGEAPFCKFSLKFY